MAAQACKPLALGHFQGAEPTPLCSAGAHVLQQQQGSSWQSSAYACGQLLHHTPHPSVPGLALGSGLLTPLELQIARKALHRSLRIHT